MRPEKIPPEKLKSLNHFLLGTLITKTNDEMSFIGMELGPQIQSEEPSEKIIFPAPSENLKKYSESMVIITVSPYSEAIAITIYPQSYFDKLLGSINQFPEISTVLYDRELEIIKYHGKVVYLDSSLAPYHS